MTTSNLSITLRNAKSIFDQLNSYRKECTTLSAKHQKIIAEMIMLRAFSVLESSISEIAFKLASGACYTNKTMPILKVRAKSMSGARTNFLNYGRKKPIQNLKWTQSKSINDSIKYVMDPTSAYIDNVRIYASLLNEMRQVRNALAHSSPTAKAEFRTLVRGIYGTRSNITAGSFLISISRGKICKLEQYLLSSNIILFDLCKG
jgi:hypothetical protein